MVVGEMRRLEFICFEVKVQTFFYKIEPLFLIKILQKPSLIIRFCYFYIQFNLAHEKFKINPFFS